MHWRTSLSHAMLMIEFDRRVAEAKAKMLKLSGESPRRKWDRLVGEAATMAASASVHLRKMHEGVFSGFRQSACGT